MLLALLAPQGTLLVLRTEPSLDLLVRSATVHLVVVSAISACALAVAMATAVAAGPSSRAPAARTPTLRVLRIQVFFMREVMPFRNGRQWFCV